MSRATGSGVVEAGGFHKLKVDPFTRGFDMGLARPLSRSVRLNGFSTCLRLEQIYWNILTEIARLNACSVSALLSYVDREVHLRYGGVKNFSGLVRVVCVVHLLKGRVEP
ncbi:ribbon-helix-helix domain-containing protein [Pseudomonas syringae]|uniref:ribbon-helix-helix domain-containing protein n=1 Tax=Pseudomonas syringae TaxID=317 RepID=UPI000F025A97|nr:ribbon-helix-helix domain-containing protein [Pseudomonas syringae]MCF5724864.1 aryl-sulfate sulfotransferase [Pseudomonas syringae]